MRALGLSELSRFIWGRRKVTNIPDGLKDLMTKTVFTLSPAYLEVSFLKIDEINHRMTKLRE